MLDMAHRGVPREGEACPGDDDSSVPVADGHAVAEG
jgi:hypothetical protein